ncbi:MAG: hypothetical protein WA667_18590 [Candidatus Nitrosopolaris sp.]
MFHVLKRFRFRYYFFMSRCSLCSIFFKCLILLFASGPVVADHHAYYGGYGGYDGFFGCLNVYLGKHVCLDAAAAENLYKSP